MTAPSSSPSLLSRLCLTVACIFPLIIGVVVVVIIPLISSGTFCNENSLVADGFINSVEDDEGERGASIAARYLEQRYQEAQASSSTHHQDHHTMYLPCSTEWLMSEFKDATSQDVISMPFQVAQRGPTYTNLVSVLRAPKGDGKEAVVITAQYCRQGGRVVNNNGAAVFTSGGATDLGVVLSFLEWLRVEEEQAYQAMDIAIVLLDGRAPAGSAAQAAVDSLQGRYRSNHHQSSTVSSSVSLGLIRAVINLDVPFATMAVPKSRLERQMLMDEIIPLPLPFVSVLHQGVNGALPNLDVPNIINLNVDRNGMSAAPSRTVACPNLQKYTNWMTESKATTTSFGNSSNVPRGLWLSIFGDHGGLLKPSATQDAWDRRPFYMRFGAPAFPLNLSSEWMGEVLQWVQRVWTGVQASPVVQRIYCQYGLFFLESILGLPQGDHFAFVAQGIDAATIASPAFPHTSHTSSRVVSPLVIKSMQREESMLTQKLVGVIGGSFRSYNALSEKLHHPPHRYLLIGSANFWSYVQYLPVPPPASIFWLAFVLMCIPVARALTRSGTDEQSSRVSSDGLTFGVGVFVLAMVAGLMWLVSSLDALDALVYRLEDRRFDQGVWWATSSSSLTSATSATLMWLLIGAGLCLAFLLYSFRMSKSLSPIDVSVGLDLLRLLLLSFVGVGLLVTAHLNMCFSMFMALWLFPVAFISTRSLVQCSLGMYIIRLVVSLGVIIITSPPTLLFLFGLILDRNLLGHDTSSYVASVMDPSLVLSADPSYEGLRWWVDHGWGEQGLGLAPSVTLFLIQWRRFGHLFIPFLCMVHYPATMIAAFISLTFPFRTHKLKDD